MKLINNYLFLLVSILVFNNSFSQEIEIPNVLITDRPDATEASSTVGKGTLQIETGAFYDSFTNNNVNFKNYTINTTLIRYGILENLELRIGWDFVEGITTENNLKLNNITSGLSPLLLGVKIDVSKEQNGMPEIEFIGHIFPLFSASKDFRPESTAVDFRFSLSHTLNDKSSLGYNLGAEWGNDSPEVSGIYTVAYGHSLTSRFGFYVELYGDLPEDSKANHYWDAGFTYLISNNLQLDTYLGTSLTSGQDILIGLGASFRFLKKN